MFDYISKKSSFLINLGKYISHKVVTEYEPTSGTRIKTPEEINNLDRVSLAKEFINRRSEYFNDLTITEEIIYDIAKYIDKRIPQAYKKHLEKQHDLAPSKLEVVAEEYGLIYQFEPVVKYEVFVASATEKID